MKFLSGLTAAASILSITIAAPTPSSSPVENSIEKRATCKGHANLVNLDWHASGGGYNRWKWAFAGFSCGEFHDALNTWWLPNDAGIANRQCWDSGDHVTFYMEHTTTKGSEIDGAVFMSVKSVTGQPCKDLSLPDWGLSTCEEKALTPAHSMCQK